MFYISHLLVKNMFGFIAKSRFNSDNHAKLVCLLNSKNVVFFGITGLTPQAN